MTSDNVKQVICWRNDLKVRKGKFGAQIAHGSIAFLANRIREGERSRYNNNTSHPDQLNRAVITYTDAEQTWLEGRFTKIVLRVDSLEELLAIHEKAKEAGLESHLIEDAGLTEFTEPTITCVGIGPDYSDRIDKVTGNLELM